MLEGNKEIAVCCWETGLLGYFHREAAAKLLFPHVLSLGHVPALCNCYRNLLAQAACPFLLLSRQLPNNCVFSPHKSKALGSCSSVAIRVEVTVCSWSSPWLKRFMCELWLPLVSMMGAVVCQSCCRLHGMSKMLSSAERMWARVKPTQVSAFGACTGLSRAIWKFSG